MSGAPSPVWSDAVLAAAVLAVDPVGTGGVVLRARPGPVRDAWLALIANALPPGTPLRRMPAHISDGRLLGELDVALTLASGRTCVTAGLLAEADGGLVVAAMAERLAPGVVTHLAAALDAGAVCVERDGLTLRPATRIGVIALDEGQGDDERAPAPLLDRLACHLDLDRIAISDIGEGGVDGPAILAARALLPAVACDARQLAALCGAALSLGIASLRAPLLARRVAGASAALAGRALVSDDDLAVAARLVLAPRALVLPPAPAETSPDHDEPPDDCDPANREAQTAASGTARLEDRVVAAAAARLPADLMALFDRDARQRQQVRAAGRSGQWQRAPSHGRAVGVRAGRPRDGARLSIVETLRAAAPWQSLRRGGDAARAGVARRVYIEKSDLRIVRFKRRTETTIIFVVDASGSAANQRLAETKGAVELLLAECYVRRDQVALLAFRKQAAELLLPPTRSLVRAKRSLAALPGGGGTPLAAGLDAAACLADASRRKGQTPLIIMLTDGRANIARDGSAGREKAEADALASARLLRSAGLPGLLVDTAPRPQPAAKAIAAAMGAAYVALPFADSAGLARAVREAAPA